MKQAVAILLNGASSSGKSTLCRALHDQLTELADGDPASAYGLVAFDDMALLLSDRLFPRTLVHLQGGDTSRLVSHKPHDGRAAWEYVDDSHTDGRHGGAPRLSLRFNPLGRRILAGLHRSWGQHLELGTNLIIDHFLQEQDWQDEVLALLRGLRGSAAAGGGALLPGRTGASGIWSRRWASRGATPRPSPPQ